MRRLLAIFVLIAFGGASTLAAASVSPPVTVERYIVAYGPQVLGVEPGDSVLGAHVVSFLPGLNFAIVEVLDVPQFLAAALLDPDVRYVEWDNPNAASLSLVPNDARYGDAGHWGSKKIGAEAAWDRSLGTTAVKVAMIDSGLNKNHEEFAGSGRVLPGWDYYNDDSDPDDTSGCSFHGTHTTGTAGATINNGVGIAGLSQHTILPLKAFQPVLGCGGSTTALVNALKAAGDQGSHLSSNSWGSSASSAAFNDAITYSHNLGVVHVAAAGNSGSCTNCVGFPWKDMGSIVIVVSSSTSTDGFSSFSSEGPQVDVIAPGSSILSSTSAPSGYGLLSGTSMAAPHVTGTAALVKALNPTFGFTDIENRIKSTAVNIGLSTDRQGAGRLNADGATQGGTPPPAACADGLDNDGDGLIDYPADPGCTSASDTDETDAPPPPTTSVHTHAIDTALKGRTPRFTVWSFGNTEAAESGVSVSVQVCKTGGSCTTGTAATATDGSVTFQWKNAGAGTYQTCVTSMAKSGFTWDSAAGHASGGNCHTATV